MTRTHLFGGALFFAGLTTGAADGSRDFAKRGGRRLAAALVATASLVAAPASFADIIHVPNDFPTIQGAIDASVDGDEVVVAPGEYVESINFLGKTIILRSVHGAEVTTIDGNDAGRVVTCDSGEGPGTTLEGFTITGGYSAYPDLFGGGMFIGDGSSATVTDCTLDGNDGYCGGGGLYNNGVATISDCVFVDNSSLWGGGLANSGIAMITGCAIAWNVSDDGGGVANNGYLTAINCTIDENGAYSQGGGIRNLGNVILIACDVSGNLAGDFFVGDGHGGGMNTNSGYALAINSTFTNNEVYGYHGYASGGGVAGDGTFVNCTFTSNYAQYAGDAVSGNPTITNSIIWNGADSIDGDATVSFSNIEGGWAGEGNIDADPLFVDPENGDYRLSDGSPCIDAGDNTEVPPDEFDLDEDGDTDEALPFDLDGNPRFVDDPATKDTGNGKPPIVDMGAYEFQVVASCPWDLDGDNSVGTGDLILLLGSWGDPYGTADLIELLGNWGPCE